jgi:23S rRNA-/tRNA-specific pseudouridylate synthase
MDPDFCVLNKPAGWLSVPGRTAQEVPVLADWLECAGSSPLRGQKAWVVHRLDRDTTGVILFARNADSHRRACLAFENRETRKIYECLAQGRPLLPVFRVADPIEGAPSQSQVEVLRQGVQGFHARVRIFTGRRHQIRIHMASRGHPIWGDVRYGGAARVSGVDLGRVALHARTLEVQGVGRFEAPLPEDIVKWSGLLDGSVAGGAGVAGERA